MLPSDPHVRPRILLSRCFPLLFADYLTKIWVVLELLKRGLERRVPIDGKALFF